MWPTTPSERTVRGQKSTESSSWLFSPARFDDAAHVVEDGHGPLPVQKYALPVRCFLARILTAMSAQRSSSSSCSSNLRDQENRPSSPPWQNHCPPGLKQLPKQPPMVGGGHLPGIWYLGGLSAPIQTWGGLVSQTQYLGGWCGLLCVLSVKESTWS
jgi:hypothetical protein